MRLFASGIEEIIEQWRDIFSLSLAPELRAADAH
jgi:hypothetical protein